jgi:hypothetical protein
MGIDLVRKWQRLRAKDARNSDVAAAIENLQ